MNPYLMCTTCIEYTLNECIFRKSLKHPNMRYSRSSVRHNPHFLAIIFAASYGKINRKFILFYIIMH